MKEAKNNEKTNCSNNFNIIYSIFFSLAYAAEPTWHDNTRNERIESSNVSDAGEESEVNDWGSDSFVAKDKFDTDKASEEAAEKRSMSSEMATSAALAVVAAGAALLRRRGGKMPEKGGIYIAENDRNTILERINAITAKTYYVDADGYLREDKAALRKETGSDTYDSLLSGIINSEKRIIIGCDSRYTAIDREEDLDGGIAIGDNGTDQVVIVNSDSDPYTLAHELSHAFRGIYKQRNETQAEINADEEGRAIQAENQIRYETGASLRTDGDSRIDADGDGKADGDGSYGQIEGELSPDWIYERQQELKEASGSVFSFLKKSSKKSTSSSKKSSTTSKKTTSTSKKSTGGIGSAIKKSVKKAAESVKKKRPKDNNKSKRKEQGESRKAKPKGKQEKQ